MPEIYVPLQPWTCDKCSARGEVPAPMTMIYSELVEEVAKQHEQLNSECHAAYGTYYMRLTQTAPD